MQLPIPILSEGNAYREVTLKKPTPRVLADASAAKERGDIYDAMYAFTAGCITAVGDVTDAGKTRALCQKMAYQSTAAVIDDILILYHGKRDAGFEGLYRCPMCKTELRTERLYNDKGEIIFDNLDYLTDFPRGMMDQYSQIMVEIGEPHVITDDEGKVLVDVRSITLDHPTMAHCMAAHRRVGGSGSSALQLQIYIEALTAVNGEPVDQVWKNRYGMLMMERMPDTRPLEEINRQIFRYGPKHEAKKTCRKCGKVWMQQIDTSNFFVSMLS